MFLASFRFIILIYTPLNEFLNVFFAQSDFGERKSQKATSLDLSYPKYTLGISSFLKYIIVYSFLSISDNIQEIPDPVQKGL